MPAARGSGAPESDLELRSGALVRALARRALVANFGEQLRRIDIRQRAIDHRVTPMWFR